MSVTQQVIEEGEQWGFECGREAERTYIVTWLRSSVLNHEGPCVPEDLADRIQRGEHLTAPLPDGKE